MRFILRTMLVALVAFEGCKDTKKDEKTPANPPANNGGDPNVAPNGGSQGGKQQQLTPNGGTGKKKTPILPKKPSKQAEVKIKVKGDAADAAEKEVTIKGLFYEKDKSGEFDKMIEDEANKNTLFVFNDFAEDFDAFVALPAADRNADAVGCKAGEGNAVIRPARCTAKQNAAGVPIGPKAGEKGYQALDEASKKKISDAIAAIRKLVSEKDFNTIVFNQASDVAGMIFTGDVEVHADVKKFIYDSLLTLEAKTA